MDQIM